MVDGRHDSIDDWKKYLHSKSLLKEERQGFSSANFAKAMCRLDRIIAAKVTSTKGMIWRNGQINPNATIADVDSALNLLSKFGQASLDDLGDPSEPDRLSGTPINSQFISQEDSKLDEFSPGNNQNQGAQGSTTPKNSNSFGKEKSEKQPKNPNVDERMMQLTNLIENVKK